MSFTIYTSAPSALIPQPGRAVNTFPSGLVRVDQTYLGLTTEAATHRAILAVGNDMPDGDSSPCIDGLKIFPEAQERRREDGFTEYLVSAYGRVNSTGNKTFSKELGSQNFIASIAPSTGGPPSSSGYSIQVTCDLLIWKFVTPKISSPNVTITENLKIFRLNGSELSSVQISEFFSTANLAGLNKPTSVSFSTPEQITLAENTNYGAFDEWTVTYKAVPQLVSLGGWQRTDAPSKPANYNPDTFYTDLPFNGFNLLDVNRNGAAQLSVVSVENIDAPSGSWNSATPKTNVPLNNQPVGTYLGGTAVVNNTRLIYTPPVVNRPAPVTVMGSSTPPAPYEVVNGPFTFRRKLQNIRTDSDATYYDYVWELLSVHEVFVIEITNENNQAASYSIQVLFSDPEPE